MLPDIVWYIVSQYVNITLLCKKFYQITHTIKLSTTSFDIKVFNNLKKLSLKKCNPNFNLSLLKNLNYLKINEKIKISAYDLKDLFINNKNLLYLNLDLTMSHFADDDPLLFSSEHNIKYLILKCILIPQHITQSIIDNCKNLVCFDVEICKMNDEQFYDLCKNNKLQYLSHSSKISNECYEKVFSENTNLEYINFMFDKIINNNSILKLTQSTNLKYLNLSNNTVITDSSIIILFQKCLNLEYLNLKHNNNITNTSFKNLYECRMKLKLKHLIIYHIYPITILYLCELFPNLEELSGQYTRFVNDKSLFLLMCNCKNLKNLELVLNNEITDIGLHHLSKLKLTTLKIMGNGNFTIDGFNALCFNNESSKTLKSLSFSGSKINFTVPLSSMPVNLDYYRDWKIIFQRRK